MDLAPILDRLDAADASVWLDLEGKLRISKGAPSELKALVREHKQALVDLRTAQAIMNGVGIRIIRLPLGEFALAYPPGAARDETRWAAGVLGMSEMPLVINDEDCVWISFDQWRRRQPLCTRQDFEAHHRKLEAEKAAQTKPKSRRRVA